MKNHQKTGIWILALLIVIAFFIASIMQSSGTGLIKTADYSDFLSFVDQGKIKKVIISGTMAEATPTPDLAKDLSRSEGVPDQAVKLKVQLPQDNPASTLEPR